MKSHGVFCAASNRTKVPPICHKGADWRNFHSKRRNSLSWCCTWTLTMRCEVDVVPWQGEEHYVPKHLGNITGVCLKTTPNRPHSYTAPILPWQFICGIYIFRILDEFYFWMIHVNHLLLLRKYHEMENVGIRNFAWMRTKSREWKTHTNFTEPQGLYLIWGKPYFQFVSLCGATNAHMIVSVGFETWHGGGIIRRGLQ